MGGLTKNFTYPKKQNITIVVYIAISMLYRLLLDYNYIKIVYPVNSYDNFSLNPSDLFLSWTLFGVFILLSLSYIKTSHSFISILVIFILFFKVIPFTSYIYCCNISFDVILYETLYFCMILICFKYIPAFILPTPKYSPIVINTIAIVLITVILLISSVYARFRLHLNLMDVYDLREEARGYDIPIILQYLHNAASKILPILLIYYLEQKKRIMIIAIIIAILLSFGVNGLKSTFLNLIICLLLYYFRNAPILKRIPLIFTMVIALGTMEFWVFKTFWVDQLFVRRLLFMPTLIDTYYFDYIKEHGPLYFNSMVNDTDVSFIIGRAWRSAACRANNGLFSDAFSNLGLAGIFIYPIFYALFFKSFGRIIDQKDFIIRFFAAFIIAYIMLSSFFTVTLLSHGIFLMCLAIMYMPNKNHINEFT